MSKSTDNVNIAVGPQGQIPTVHVETFGPTPERMREVSNAVVKHSAVQRYLANTQNRLIRIDLLDIERDSKNERPQPPEKFRAYFADYTNDRTIIATGSIADPSSLEVIDSSIQPLPSSEEFQEAVRIIKGDHNIGIAVNEGRLIPYTAMPP